MKRIYCRPGHGVSIGSLGKDNSAGIVTKVVLDTALLRETTNGVRIETWQGGSGYVRFENVRMESFANSTVISNLHPASCKSLSANDNTDHTNYCETTPCSNINLEKDDTAETYCNSAQGFGYGILSQDKGYILTDHNENTELAERTEDLIIHTEL
ncbi:hypothetical protein V6N11_067524 [Hibiscus sabdariffa]|uniref:Polygalacturonase n=1 Tax=Hibiscus sabdariffa TaxID=183260 RepID=A0ABR2SR55_9ROSI